jgi:hypothetical protein
MRAIVLVLMMGLWLISCRENDAKTNGVSSMQLPKDTSQFTKITWLDSTIRDFGSIPEGQKLEVADVRLLNNLMHPLCQEKRVL